MKRVVQKIAISDPEKFSKQLLAWVQTYETFLCLDSNYYPQKYSSFNKVVAFGVHSELQTNYENAFATLDRYQKDTEDYIFGYFGYDLKNDTEKLDSNNFDGLGFPDLYFFQPEKIIFVNTDYAEFHYDTSCAAEIETDLQQIHKCILSTDNNPNSVKIQQRISEKNYFSKIDKVQKHIQRGDSYEVNFCMEYFAEKATINPLSVYTQLNAISKPPFACLLRHKSHFLLSASPERFVRKEGRKIISQPIKGTIGRGKNTAEDLELIERLKIDPKERAENIMIVDLVRNDLSKTATIDSVQVEDLCEVYTFKQVHQLISTVTSKAKTTISPVQIIKSLFPMGSMTGAPKIATMKIIENLEETKRGLYSGSVGYFSPEGNFDFNVVIRSILYNMKKEYVSFSVGGAITAKSNPKSEYQECQLKAAAMKNTLK